MSERPVRLADRRLEPVSEVVALLEEVLARAKQGEVRGIAIAASCDVGADGSAFEVGDGTIAQLSLGLDRVKLRLLEWSG